MYRSAVRVCKICARQHGSTWAEAKAALGMALAVAADGQGGLGYSPEGIAAIREALSVLTEERDRLAWAHAQVYLGYALTRPGEQAGETALLDEAVGAISKALKIFSPGRAPSDWAEAQVYLGRVLEVLDRHRSRRGTLEEANQAYRNALHYKNVLGPSLVEIAQTGEQRTGLSRAK